MISSLYGEATERGISYKNLLHGVSIAGESKPNPVKRRHHEILKEEG